MSRAQRLGLWGEDVACVLLQACGYRLLDRRYRRAGGEIDLVMRRSDVVVFIEVKTRGPSAPADPEAWVDRRKLGRLRRTARNWMADRPETGARSFRIDVVAIRHGGADGGVDIRHLVGVG